jgi:hypothetical protein
MLTQASRTLGTAPNVDARTPEYWPRSPTVIVDPPDPPLLPELLQPLATAHNMTPPSAVAAILRHLIRDSLQPVNPTLADPQTV